MAAAAPADAVTGQALAWQDALRRRGVGGEVFAEHVHPRLAGRVRPLADFRPGAEPVLLRMSLWSAAVERAVEVPRERLGIVYHNITPAHLLKRTNPGLATLCARGRNALPDLAGRVSVAIADSGYNARELEGAGFPDPVVVPLLLDVPAAPPPRAGEPAPRVLTVGRVSPSKRIEDVVRAVAVLRRHLVPAARLDVIGSWEGEEGYRAALGRFVSRLGLDDAVRFHGRVGDAERDRAYAEGGAYLCMSEHEGFCAPLVEALGRGLPVVARDAGAVAETLGGAGLVVPGRDAALAAEALAAVLARADLRAELAARATRRLAELAPERVEAVMAAALAPLLA
jgi:glycosyltransferase involved in cell wall biosynthesis